MDFCCPVWVSPNPPSVDRPDKPQVMHLIRNATNISGTIIHPMDTTNITKRFPWSVEKSLQEGKTENEASGKRTRVEDNERSAAVSVGMDLEELSHSCTINESSPASSLL
eukprot:gb/GECG01014072.1/.p1 GENE.gb/GECG01014072.1/~~gb/GECG01014072.1/.p1  ORF type:complete len:110 (+),score=8.94 gb/GECG01014072.1/:1-330(+)